LPESVQLRFVLVEPRSGGNVGAAARALKNLGFHRLEVVNPRCDPKGSEAMRMAVDAADLLSELPVHRGLDQALGRATTVIGTSRRTGKHRRPHRRLDEAAEDLARLAAAGETAVLFGREDHGLSDVELDRCTHLVHLPAAEVYPSFNLAQSVLLVAYELRRARLRPSGPDRDPPTAPAGHDEREAMYRHLQRSLTTIGFLKPQSSEVIMRQIRRALGRAELSPSEVRILRGIAHQILWAAAVAGLDEAEDAR